MPASRKRNVDSGGTSEGQENKTYWEMQAGTDSVLTCVTLSKESSQLCTNKNINSVLKILRFSGDGGL